MLLPAGIWFQDICSWNRHSRWRSQIPAIIHLRYVLPSGPRTRTSLLNQSLKTPDRKEWPRADELWLLHVGCHVIYHICTAPYILNQTLSRQFDHITLPFLPLLKYANCFQFYSDASFRECRTEASVVLIGESRFGLVEVDWKPELVAQKKFKTYIDPARLETGEEKLTHAGNKNITLWELRAFFDRTSARGKHAERERELLLREKKHKSFSETLVW